jgi:hypothetical protein
MSKYKLVKVRWVDSCMPRTGWTLLADWKGTAPAECVSIGYIVDERNNTTAIAPHLAYPDEPEQCQADGIMIIPNQAILSIEELISSSRGVPLQPSQVCAA